MSSDWDEEAYRVRERQWRKAATALPLGEERDSCLSLAEGYARLVWLIEQRHAKSRGLSATSISDDRRGQAIRSADR